MDNKKLIDKVARKLGRNKGDVSKLLEAFTSIVATRCSEMDSIVVPGFGSFEPRKRNERVIANPSNGKRTLFPPKITLHFKVSAVLKNKLK